MKETQIPSPKHGGFTRLALVSLAAGVLLVLVVLGRSWLSSEKEETPPAPVEASEVERTPNLPPLANPSEFAPVTSSAGSGSPAPGAQASTRNPRLSLPPPSAEARQTVAQLAMLEAVEPLTTEGAAQWKVNFDQLLAGGVDSVSAISEALKPNTERFFTAEEAALLGYPSARAALLDALAKIGGPEAISVLGDVLDVAAAPREIALVAKSLETLAPGEFTDQAVEAARQSLAMAREKELEGFDVAPLFEVLQNYGGANSLNELESASRYWNYYGTVALANLPDAAGVPSLIRMASVDERGVAGPGRLQALQMLAQLAGSNEDARNALLQQAEANQISPNLWPYLARPLAGEEAHVQDSVLNANAPNLAASRTSSSHIKHNNQNFFFAPAGGGLTPEQVSQQLGLIDQLSKVTTDPQALQMLERTRAALERQAPRLPN